MNKDIKIIFEQYRKINEQTAQPIVPVDSLSEADYKSVVDALARIQEANENFYKVAKNANLLVDKEIQIKRQNSSNSISKYINLINSKVDNTDTGMMQKLQQYVSGKFNKFKSLFTGAEKQESPVNAKTIDSEDRIDVIGPYGKVINVTTRVAKMLGMKPVATK